MKTLTLNKKNILFGMLVVSLGFSKSWLQTADASNKFDLSSSASNFNINTEVEGHDYQVGVVLTTKEVEVLDVSNNVAGTKIAKITEASFNDNGCTSCITSFQITSMTDTADLMNQLTKHINKEKMKNLKKEQEEKELAEAIANCEKTADGKDLDDSKNASLRASCMTKKIIAENPGRENRQALRDAFQHEIVDDLQQQLLESNSAAERSKILASIKEIRKGLRGQLRSNAGLDADLRLLEKGAKAMNQIPMLANDSLLNPNSKLQNDLAIDRLAWDFNFRTNQGLNRYSEETQDSIRDWSSYVLPLATQAQKNPEQVTREFFESFTGDGLNPIAGNNNNGSILSASGSRSQRVDMGGMQYIPRYLDANTLQQFQQSQGNNNIDPRTGRPYIQNGQGFQVNPGAGTGSRFLPSGQQYSPSAPGYTRGGIPQTGRRI